MIIYKLEISYAEAEADTASSVHEDIKKCLHAGQIPDAYKEVIQDMKVEVYKEKRKYPLCKQECLQALQEQE